VSQTPQLDLKLPQSALCSRHGEPFRKAWPTGYAQIAILAIEFIQTDEDLAAEAGADVTRIPALLLARPVCERVAAGRIRQAYVDAKIGVEGTCVVCGRERLGTEYQRSVPGRFGARKVVTDRHVCFDCVLERMRPA
jgi:hypothetical protein